jgi:hypothetical protein
MDYRIKFTSWVGKEIHERVHEFSAPDDERAKDEHKQFKQKYENATCYTKYMVGGLERIDQREITTRII